MVGLEFPTALCYSKFMSYGEEYFIELAANDPEQLVELIKGSTLSTVELTFAAEAMGLADSSTKLVEATLLPLLDHKEALVREGALYGLSYRLVSSAAKKKIMALAKDDPSKGVRDSAKETLFWME